MDHYEELGLSREATETEIRRSYKRLTVLFHPDQHSDPDVRALAEMQMKRVNEMAAVLTDPERRRLYDESLRAAASAFRHSRWARWAICTRWIRHNQVWVLATSAAMITLTLAALIPTEKPHLAAEPQELTAQLVGSEAGAKPAQVRGATRAKGPPVAARSNRSSPGESDTGLLIAAEPYRPRPAEATDASGAGAEQKRVPQIAAPPPLQLSATQAPLVSPEVRLPEQLAVAGKWVYTPDPIEPRDPKLFPADYIELTISIAGGRLRGSYRSRYKVPDAAISPVVNFTFEGPVSGASFLWRNDAGASGEVMLHMHSRDILDVRWFATAMGSTLSLGSGTATLFRF